VKRFLLVLGALGAVAAAFALAAYTSSGTTIGQTSTSPLPCAPRIVAFQTAVSAGSSFTVPAGAWQTTSWTTASGSAVGPMAAMVVRPTGTQHQYTVVAVSPTVTPTGLQVNTFPWTATVQGGDLLGLWNGVPTNDCAAETGQVGDTYEFAVAGTKPVAGATLSTVPGNISVLNISANLVSPGSGASGVHHVYVCYSKFEQDGGEVEDVATAGALVAAGRWYPTALPGNVDGGENVGGYHLSCNPPATSAPTGQYVGIGGAVTDYATAGSYAIAD
jgi:hypothetical protein